MYAVKLPVRKLVSYSKVYLIFSTKNVHMYCEARRSDLQEGERKVEQDATCS